MSNVPEDGTMLPYRDKSLSIDERVGDLLARMTLEEKAGTCFHNMITLGPDGSLSDANPAFNLDSTETAVGEKHMSHFNLIGPIDDPRMTAQWHNLLQERALQTRLGIPITLSTDPRNHFTDNPGTAFNAGSFSQWPETLGLAAIRSPKLVENFANVARQEYLAVGLRVALHPQIDLATEPRWARINATFGEDANLSGELVEAYIHGFQGSKLGPESVATMTKHFPGGGPQKDGEDPHFPYGREQVYPGNNFEYHLKPFKKAIAAGGSQFMPYYGMPVGTEYEEVGFAFNKGVITGLLREKLGFQGIVCSDWGLVTDASILGQSMPARAWGCEHLSELERVVKIINAGCDQYGGEACPKYVIEAVKNGMISEARVDESVRRLLKEKFVLGLFDKPFIDVEHAATTVGKEDFRRAGEDAQRRAYTLLKNEKDILPLKFKEGTKLYIEGLSADLLKARLPTIELIEAPVQADIAVLRLKAPYDRSRTGGFEQFFHAGALDFSTDEKTRQAKIYNAVPTIVDLYLDRPAVVPEIAEKAAAFLCSYGSSADAFLDVLLGQAKPEGKLPFDLPSSIEAVKNSREDMPFDTKNPVYRFGDGLSYS
ncbi:hypothetical protein H2198_008544 [Neophaeococcomyces mojaviensis]|uniref:Uncharacterized protein n=1 Tax=Neophaeococcomyces mojaviensis TaxID=3383035 RepID=A0ACC2ZXA3_9EURO|nr:hypothetical protein H2198_008544 [Knufia sp. JES_112]